jgi:hypothetical protein
MSLGIGACTQGEGERCNPLRVTSDCDPGLACVYPTAPMCGVSFCCTVDRQATSPAAILTASQIRWLPRSACSTSPPALWTAAAIER